jgi:hypothetical protein
MIFLLNLKARSVRIFVQRYWDIYKNYIQTQTEGVRAAGPFGPGHWPGEVGKYTLI